MTLRPIRAVVFDLDGTLCDYAVTVREALAEALVRTGQPTSRLGELDAAAARYDVLWEEISLNGHGAGSLREAIMIRLLNERGIDDPELARDVTAHYTQVRWPSLRLLPGVAKLLDDLHARYTLGLLTNGPTDMQRPKLAHLEIEPFFEAIVVSGEVGLHKPDPAAFELVLERLDRTAAEALYVGNSLPTDIVGAKTAGLQAAWVNSDGRAADGVAPDLTVRRTADLREVLL